MNLTFKETWKYISYKKNGKIRHIHVIIGTGLGIDTFTRVQPSEQLLYYLPQLWSCRIVSRGHLQGYANIATKTPAKVTAAH